MLYSKKLMAHRIPKHSQSVLSSHSKDHSELSYTYDGKEQSYRLPCSFQTLKWKSSFINLAVFSCLDTEKTTCFILFSVLNIVLLDLSASPSSVFNTALFSATAEECEMLLSELPEIHASETLSELYLGTHYREWTQILTIAAAWKLLWQKYRDTLFSCLPGATHYIPLGMSTAFYLSATFFCLVGFVSQMGQKISKSLLIHEKACLDSVLSFLGELICLSPSSCIWF